MEKNSDILLCFYVMTFIPSLMLYGIVDNQTHVLGIFYELQDKENIRK